MTRARQYQALLAGAVIATVLLFLLAQLVRSHNRNGLAILHGDLPPIPEYEASDKTELHEALGNESELEIQQTSTTKSAEIAPSETPSKQWDASWNDKNFWPNISKSAPTPASVSTGWTLPTNHISHTAVEKYVHSILGFENDSFPGFERISCPSKIGSRYSLLRDQAAGSGQVQYFFALNLHQSTGIISRLMSSIVEAMRFLGPEHCAISIVEGHSDDGTYEILAALKMHVEAMGAQFFLTTSTINPKAEGEDRIKRLSELRNKALEPLKVSAATGPISELAGMFSPDALIIFINDVALCPEDILELVFQHVNQDAHMTCAFDWISDGTLFYDVWVSRSLIGNTFFEIPHDGSWSYSQDLFWDDPDGRRRFEKSQPFQVYSCWGGMAVLDAAPFAEGVVSFRSSKHGECLMGEPLLLAKDLYRRGRGKILAVPAVNLAYADDEAVGTKDVRGYVHDHVNVSKSELDQEEIVSWQRTPPAMVKCLPTFDNPSWVEPT
jgi:alpha-1,3-mannosyltransferase